MQHVEQVGLVQQGREDLSWQAEPVDLVEGDGGRAALAQEGGDGIARRLQSPRRATTSGADRALCTSSRSSTLYLLALQVTHQSAVTSTKTRLRWASASTMACSERAAARQCDRRCPTPAP